MPRFLSSSYYNAEDPDLKVKTNKPLKIEAARAPKTFKSSRAVQYVFYDMETGAPDPIDTAQSNIEEIDPLLLDFRNHLCDINHLLELTIASQINHVRRFLQFIYDKYLDKLSVSNVDANDIRLFFVEEV